MAARDVTVAQGRAYPIPGRRPRVEVDAGRLARRGEAAGLIVLMAIGSVALWTAVPVAGLWLASQFTTDFTQPTTASAVTVMLGIPALMALTGKGPGGLGARGRARVRRLVLLLRGVEPAALRSEGSESA